MITKYTYIFLHLPLPSPAPRFTGLPPSPVRRSTRLQAAYARNNMASPICSSLLLALLLFICPVISSATDGNKRLYVVYMGEKHHDDPNVVTTLHHDTLARVLGSKEAAQQEIVYSYKHGFSGFAAMLTDSQAQKLSKLPGVLRVSPSYPLQLHTTRSWDFLHLSDKEPSALLKRSNYGDGIIAGVIDTGIWPESKSFNDKGYGPVPKRWKGTCQEGEEFNSSHCNLKIIGARYYTGGLNKSDIKALGDYLSPRGDNTHGTKVASIVAGSYVKNVSVHGLGAGTARGGAPKACLAIYKVFYGSHGSQIGNDASLIAAIDDAIHDGVDILSMSLGLAENSWATLHAVSKGIVVVYAAANQGPTPETVWNTSPWVITVAATTMDRSFPTAITLGNNQTAIGQSIFVPKSNMHDRFFSMVYIKSCENIQSANLTGKMQGKYVLCYVGADPPSFSLEMADKAVRAANASGMIFAQYSTSQLTQVDTPIAKVDFKILKQILQYWVQSESSGMAKISPTRTMEGKQVLAPVVAFFSSRGPSKEFPAILKPDIAAPGVNILAAAKDSYGFSLGTSMATPHVSGIVALMKVVHPNWSPAAIKSAIITTALTTDQHGMPIMAEGVPRKIADPFDFGGGFINPDNLTEPGLVYDIDPKDYQILHCTWNESLVLTFCKTTQHPVYHLNLPYVVIPHLESEVDVYRTVTNVGPTNSIYKVFVKPPSGVEMVVEPPTLIFNATTSKITYKVTFRALEHIQGLYTFGSLTWHDKRHRVRIPIAVRIVIFDNFADTG